jgi:phosphoenolpyruvate carboxykinase (ATP)
MEPDPVFGLAIPTTVAGVPNGVLRPRECWSDRAAYDRAAHRLAGMFAENFAQYASEVTAEIRGAGPRV